MIAGDRIIHDMGRGAEAYLQMWERADGIQGVRCDKWRQRFLTAKGFARKLELGMSARPRARPRRAAGEPYADLALLRQRAQDGAPDGEEDRQSPGRRRVRSPRSGGAGRQHSPQASRRRCSTWDARRGPSARRRKGWQRLVYHRRQARPHVLLRRSRQPRSLRGRRRAQGSIPRPNYGHTCAARIWIAQGLNLRPDSDRPPECGLSSLHECRDSDSTGIDRRDVWGRSRAACAGASAQEAPAA